MLIFSANFVGSKFIQDRATIANEQLRAKAIRGTMCNEVKALLEEHLLLLISTVELGLKRCAAAMHLVPNPFDPWTYGLRFPVSLDR